MHSYPLSRRSFLRALAIASMGAPVVGRGAVRQGIRVIVIGAGVSGLAAAKRLHESGIEVTVLEARRRIGGRIWTDRDTFGLPVELGAQFIQGTRGRRGAVNPVWELARERGWKSVDFAMDAAEAVRNGDEVDGEALAEQFEAFEDFIAEDILPEADAGVSVASALDRFIAKAGLDHRQAAELRAVVSSEIELEYASDAPQLSVQGAAADSSYGIGGNRILAGGYDQLPAFLAAGLTRVRLGEEVTSLDYSGAVCKVHTTQAAYEAEHVLCSLPLGVLQAGKVHFVPELPAPKAQAIARMGMGVIGKVILEFPGRLWPLGTNWFLSLKATPPWGVAFSTLDCLRPDRCILVMWHHGELASQREAMSDGEVVRTALDEIRIATGDPVPTPTAWSITRWGRDPFSRGAYSFPRIGSPSSDISELARPIADRLFFAGEATSGDAFGTVHGALSSGYREAAKILRLASGH